MLSLPTMPSGENNVHYHAKGTSKLISGEEQSVVLDILNDAKAEISRLRQENLLLRERMETMTTGEPGDVPAAAADASPLVRDRARLAPALLPPLTVLNFVTNRRNRSRKRSR